MAWLSRRHRVSGILFTAAAATLAVTSDVFAQFETLAVPPISGFQPMVVFGLTDEQADPDDLDAGAHASTTPLGNGMTANSLPVGQPQKFFVGVFDTGAQASILSADTGAQVNLAGAGREGTLHQEIVGASGSEFPEVTDALGVYFTGFGNGTNAGGNLNVTPGTLSGMWNTSVMKAEPGSSLPNIIGVPAVGLYQVAIKNTQPFHVTAGGTTYRSPQLTFAPRNTTIPASYGKIALSVTSNVGDPPSYIPDLNAILDPNWDGNFGNNPATPTIWESMFVNVNLTHTGGAETRSFLFDTGAEVSVLSSTTAAELGIFTAGEDPTPADFTIDVLGVGGSTTQVKGYYLNQVQLVSTGGNLNFSHAPVIVLDVPDPRSPNDTLPGILGTNLLTSRDFIINVGQGNSGIFVAPQWSWRGTAGGTWGDTTKWGTGNPVPNGVDTQANFFTPTGAIAPQTVTVDASGFSVGTLAFDNSNRYTVNGPGRITMDVSVDHAQINVNNGSHTINAPMTFADDTDINVVPVGSTLAITSDVTATGVAINKLGPGTLEMKNIRAQSLSVDQGTVRLLLGQTATSGASKVSSISFTGGATPAGKLDLGAYPLAIDYDPGQSSAANVRALLQSGYASGSWTGNGIVSTIAAGVAADTNNLHKTAIGFAEASAIGSPSTWFGQGIDASSIVMRYAYLGDANLDGTVNSADFTKLAQNFNGASKYWWEGDFNFDGTVNALDFGMLASMWIISRRKRR
jgi:hypothetical protein